MNLFARPDSDIVQAVGANPDFPEILGSADTLRGKDIIYGFGSMGQYGVTAYLDLFGLTTDDVNAINMNFGPGYQAFQAGEGDVVALFTPLNYSALENGYVKMANIADMRLPVRDVILVTPETYKDPVKMEAIKPTSNSTMNWLKCSITILLCSALNWSNTMTITERLSPPQIS